MINRTKLLLILLLSVVLTLSACQSTPTDKAAPSANFDLMVVNGLVYDGLGGEPYRADIGIIADRIAAIGNDIGESEKTINAAGLAVTPGFINMLSWATDSLIEDGLSQGDIRQGVTLEVMGEGWSMGPLNEAMKAESVNRQGDIKYDIKWTTLGEYLQYLEDRGVSPNVASFVGATTVRIHELGFEDRAPKPEELQRMQELVHQAMKEGAMGLGSSLIYAPAFYADTEELIALSRVAAEHGGRYISHMRSEGNQLLESVDELISIAREAEIGAEIYHLKAAGAANWSKMDEVFERVNAARANGLDITTDMYNYTAGATGLDAAMPPWVQEGGLESWIERLKDPVIRERLAIEMSTPSDDWENLYLATGSADKVLLSGFKNPDLKYLTGKSLAEVSVLRGTSPEITMMDLVIEDGSRVGTVYFIMSEENIKKKFAQPWMAFGSDAGSMAPEGVFLLSNPHPRAYGNFSRLLGKYVRDEQVISLAEAVRRLTSFPAGNLKIQDRGTLAEGYYADIAIFDPATISDQATFAKPHQYATGMSHVIINGVPVLLDGEHTGATPGRFIKGPGFKQP
jgi:N-acyl-D-amino-acid deacylase